LTLPNTLATGGILYASATDTITGLAIGASGTLLRSNGTVPVYSSFTIPNTFAQGDILYGSATNVITALAKDASATRYLSNTGASNSPAWAQVSLTTGITGVLPVTAGGTGLSTIGEGYIIQGNAGIYIQTAPGSVGAYLRAASGILIWSTLILPNAATAGDIFYSDATNNMARLAIGTAGKILRSTGTLPAWSTLTIPNTVAQGDILYGSAANVLTALADVAVGSYLRSGGVSTAPLWSTLTLPNASAQGDIFYSTAANAMTVLVKNTSATRYLSNTGTSNDPAWAQVALATGVSGTLPIANGGTALTAYTANRILYASATDVIGTHASLTFDGTTLVTAGQLKFPATQAASADVNTLDDYEEGTWTPSDGSGAGLALTVPANNCQYIKVGQLVVASFRLSYPATADTSACTIAGLPFTCQNTANSVYGGFFSNSTLGLTPMMNVISNAATFFFRDPATGGIYTNAALSGSTQQGDVVYRASA
jgi:hypothetical protein